MDKKIRISFFPANASKVSVISISRRFGLVLLGLCLLLSLAGFWMLLSGLLHEDPAKATARRKLRSENTALRERVEALEGDAHEVGKGLKRLEGLKDDALLATGLETAGQTRPNDAGGLWTFFQRLNPTADDPSASLAMAKNIALFYDSTLVVLRNAKEQSETFPTGLPVPRSALFTRPFGVTPDPFTGKKSQHPGIDFSDKPGTPISAAGAGEVTAITRDPVWGLTVRIRHRAGMETLYAHLATATVRVGQKLNRGDVLGQMGESGQSTGPHLHYELRLQGERVNPLQFLFPADPGGHWL